MFHSARRRRSRADTSRLPVGVAEAVAAGAVPLSAGGDHLVTLLGLHLDGVGIVLLLDDLDVVRVDARVHEPGRPVRVGDQQQGPGVVRVVGQVRIELLEPTDSETLTLQTCLTYEETAPRFVVVAERIAGA